jgi:predicted NUDIX family NTP pyrophosphohydrolase
MKKSAGILIYRFTNGKIEVLLVHSNGREDLEAWSLPKGEFDLERESPSHAAVREVHEELGLNIPESELKELGESTYRNKRKRVYGFSWETKCGNLKLTPDPHEIGKASFFPADDAKRKLHEAQIVFLDRLLSQLRNKMTSPLENDHLPSCQ